MATTKKSKYRKPRIKTQAVEGYFFGTDYHSFQGPGGGDLIAICRCGCSWCVAGVCNDCDCP